MKTNLTRILSLLLALIMVLGLAACGASDAPAEEPADEPVADAPAEEPADEPAEEPAEEPASEPVTLKWYLAGNQPQGDQETVTAAMEAHILENYGLNLDLELIVTDFGSFSDKAQMIIASGEEYDIMWTSSWCNNYYTNVSKNAFIPLNDLITDELKAVIPEGHFEAAKVNGNIYAVPSYQISASQNIAVIPTRYVEEFDLDVSSIHTLTDLNDFFYAVKEAYPDVYPLALAGSSAAFGGKTPQADGYEVLANTKVPGAVLLEGDDLTVVNQFELPVTMEKLEYLYQWQQDGIIRSDVAAVTEYNTDCLAGMHACAIETSWKPYYEVDSLAVWGEDVTCIMLGEPWSATSNCIATMNAISTTCKNPEVAMEFLTLLNTDADLYNLLCFGIEGVHYTLDENGGVISDDASGYNPNCDWVFACQFNALPRSGQPADIWDLTRELSDSAKASPVMGFTFDSAPVANEMAACATVYDQYIDPIGCGVIEPVSGMAEAMEQMKIAGYETIMAELQSQLDAWAAANG